MKKLMNKKGAYGIDVVTEVALALFILLLVVVAVIIGAYALIGSNIMPTSSAQYNQTVGMVQNLTTGASSFFGSSSTFFGILVVVCIMIFLGLMIGAVMLFRGKSNSSVGK
jgi:uncharacterized membrane protein